MITATTGIRGIPYFAFLHSRRSFRIAFSRGPAYRIFVGGFPEAGSPPPVSPADIFMRRFFVHFSAASSSSDGCNFPLLPLQ
jgi:hypothetical protein